MNIEQIKKRCEAATEGPWNIWGGPAYAGGGEDLCIGAGKEWVVNMDHRISCAHDRHFEIDHCDICSGITEEQRFNAEFIAHARTDIPDLVAEVERLRGIVESAYAEGWDDGGNGGDCDPDQVDGIYYHYWGESESKISLQGDTDAVSKIILQIKVR